ncbi:hypothetical protein ACI3PL_27730, partial [Lacticaseibacillus paracasei]
MTTYGASVTEGSTTVTFGTGVVTVAAMVGKMIRLNGESADYKIISVAQSTNDTAVVDKAIRA